MSVECPNLEELAGKTYRCRTSREWFETTGNQVDNCRDTWYYEIPGKNGTIVPWGKDHLAIVVDGRRVLASSLMREPWIIRSMSMHGDDGCNAVLHVADFRKAVRWARSHRKSQMTEERKQAARELLARYKFPKKHNGLPKQEG